MIKKIIFLVVFVSSLSASTISIAVAANVSYAIKPLVAEFNKLYPDINVRVTLGSSGKLAAQIKHNAPFGLFMSADMNYPDKLYKDGIAITKPRVYAQGSLAFLSKHKQDFSKGIKLLEQKNIKKIAIANPKTAPYGKAAIEAIKNAGIYENIKDKFVYSESISQTVSYTMLATDIGIVAKSSLYNPKMSRFKNHQNWITVDKKLYTPIKQAIVILKYAKTDNNIKNFYNFVFSKQARKVFEKFGYLI